MQKITFITGNKRKLSEVQALLLSVQGKSFDLPEIQDVDLKKIVEEKLRSAVELCDGPVMVDDSALYLECFEQKNGDDGLPGPFIKWFLQTVTNEGLASMALKLGKTRARGRTMIGYADEQRNFFFFEGVVDGTVVMPQGTAGFGWDHIFIPNGFDQTFTIMGPKKKNEISPRSLAVKQLSDFLS